jgi:hypothetical protein
MEKRPFSFYLLLILVSIQALGGIWGGLSLTLSPSGKIMHMSVSMLEGSPFPNYLVPGLVLLFILGIFPAFLAYALVARPIWTWPEVLNIYRGIHWAWTFSLYLGIMLVIWILVEIMFIQQDILQTIFGLVGVVILILSLLPSNMRFFGWSKAE